MQKKIFSSLLPLVVALMFVFTGCNKDDPEFYVNVGGYIVQNNYYGEPRLSPCLFFSANNENFANFQITKDLSPVDGAMYWKQIYEVFPYYGESLSSFNEGYIYSATSEKGDVVSNKITFNVAENTLLGEMNVTEFKYESGKIVVKIANVENATEYGFFINPVIEDMPNSRYYSSEYTELAKTSTTEQVIELSFSSEFNNNIETVKISPVAINGNAGIYLHGAEKTLRKGATSFDEDESGDE